METSNNPTTFLCSSNYPLTIPFSAGYYNVERPMDLQQLQESRRVWYDHFIRQYYMKLLKRMLLTRHVSFFRKPCLLP